MTPYAYNLNNKLNVKTRIIRDKTRIIRDKTIIINILEQDIESLYTNYNELIDLSCKQKLETDHFINLTNDQNVQTDKTDKTTQTKTTQTNFLTRADTRADTKLKLIPNTVNKLIQEINTRN